MKKYFKNLVLALIALFILSSWGGTGHYLIGEKTKLYAQNELSWLQLWTDSLAAHASDPDFRKHLDPDEGHKHYIDIDNYPGFPHLPTFDRDSLILLYGEDFVNQQGILPWAIEATYDSLVWYFKQKDFDRARYFAYDLCHYVADAHQPLHITANYNGQLTGNYGIHARYESVMVDRYAGEMSFQTFHVQPIAHVRKYIFNILLQNHLYVDSIMMADSIAQARTNSNFNDEYYRILWNLTGNFTSQLMSQASHRLVEFIYTAWVEAGKPTITSSSNILSMTKPAIGLSIFPNPTSDSTIISFHLPGQGYTRLIVTSYSGKYTRVLTDKFLNAGKHQIVWSGGGHKGLYVVSLYFNNQVKSMVVEVL